MALLYTISEKGNPADQSVPKKYYLQSKIRGSKSLPEKRDRPEGTNLTDCPSGDAYSYKLFHGLPACINRNIFTESSPVRANGRKKQDKIAFFNQV